MQRRATLAAGFNMPAKRMPSRNTIDTRVGRITAWEARIDIALDRNESAGVRRSCTHGITLTVALLEPIKGRQGATLRLQSSNGGAPSNASPQLEGVGNIWAMTKTHVEMWIYMTDVERSEILALAACGRLASCQFAFRDLYRGKAEIVSFATGTVAAEDFESTF